MTETRKRWVGGNWKCNGSHEFAKNYVKSINGVHWDESKLEVAVFPPAVYARELRSTLRPEFLVGLQNVHAEGDGAFTGEHSVRMATDVGAVCALVGHSERRAKYGDTDAAVASKAISCIKDGLTAVICIGESLGERDKGETVAVVQQQVKAFADDIKDWSKVIIAYEPIWAIGTGKTASAEQVQQIHKNIRGLLETLVNSKVAQNMRIVYGGSVTKDVAPTLIGQPDIDGFLVGGASLKPDFHMIIESANK